MIYANTGGEGCLCGDCKIWEPDDTDVCIHWDDDKCPENIRASLPEPDKGEK